MRHLKQQQQAESENTILNVKAQFDVEAQSSQDEPDDFGLKYTFSLQDAIDSCPEYVSRPKILVDMAREVIPRANGQCVG